jgi:hypothetical protein
MNSLNNNVGSFAPIVYTVSTYSFGNKNNGR